MSIQISFNDDFDVEHYPLEDWHRQTIEQIVDLFDISVTVEWWYHATTHGRVFWCAIKGHQRLVATEIKQLAEVKGLRWIEPTKEKLSISLDHNEPTT